MKLTRRQLNHLIMESLNLQEARVPRPRRLIRNPDAANSRVEKLISMLNDAELYDADGDYTESELEEYREELQQYRDNIAIAKDKEFGIKPRQRKKLDPVLEKIEDYLAGQRRKRGPDGMFPQGGERSGSETAAQTPSDKGKKKRKTRAERKANRKAKGAEVAMGIVHMIGELKKKLKDETNKRRKQALEGTIDFLENRLEKLKKGEDVTEEPIPPEVSKVVSSQILKTKAESDAFMGAISGNPVSTQDLDDFLANIEKNKEIAKQAFGNEPTDYEKKKKELKNKGSGTETLAQTPEEKTIIERIEQDTDLIWLKCIPADSKNVTIKLDSTFQPFPNFIGIKLADPADVDDVNSDLSKALREKYVTKNSSKKDDQKFKNSFELFEKVGGIVTTKSFLRGIDIYITNNGEDLYIDGPGGMNYKILGMNYTKKSLTVNGRSRDYYVAGSADTELFKESHNKLYGKSHATLLRERYWGRY
jgi:hypothetical protein